MSSPKAAAKKERVDKLITDQGLARSRSHAQALIMAAQVCVGDQLIEKSSELFLPETIFRLKEGAQEIYVSRGGLKLEGALKELQKFNVNVQGMTALDVGISTGGFTDCLLQHGVKNVVGIDVGHNQLHWKIKNDPRVQSFEKINARKIPENILSESVDLIVVDVSFISLNLILPEVQKFLKPMGYIIALIKPQFEVRRQDVGKGGIVKDPLLHVQVQDKIKTRCAELSLNTLALFESPIEGTDGNKEFFIITQKN